MFDSHVHAGPDVVNRIGDDREIAERYSEAGFDGFVLKAHYESTVGRAHAVAAATGMQVFGGIALNQHCGGVNPSAVVATLQAGGRVVWMPTADAHTQHAAGLPRLCHSEPKIGDTYYAIPPVDMAAEQRTNAVLERIADYDAVLATGHVSKAECRWLLDRAEYYGISRVLLTHPSYTVPGLVPAEIQELAERGAYIEITCYQLLHQPGCTPELLSEVATAAGAQLVLSSDAGQPDSPQPPEALRLLVSTLSEHGGDPGRLAAASGEVPLQLFAP